MPLTKKERLDTFRWLVAGIHPVILEEMLETETNLDFIQAINEQIVRELEDCKPADLDNY